MQTVKSVGKNIVSAMTGGKNPWGKGSDSDSSKNNEGGEGGSSGSASAPDEPVTSGVGDADKGGDKDTGKGSGQGPRNPWLPSGGTKSDTPPRRSATIEDIFKQRGGGNNGGGSGGGSGSGRNFRIPQRPGGGSWLPIAVGAVGVIWLLFGTVHQVGAKEQGVVEWFGGKYARTLSPGLNFTFPFPLQSVDIEPVSEFRIETIPNGEAQKLMLTGDQNLVDLSYIVRWNIKDLKQYRFQLADPEETVREVAEASMRASVAEETLNRVLSGAGRAEIEADVLLRMQNLLDSYRSGIAVQGVEIRKTDPPKEVEQAFKDVSAAQQDAESYVNQAEAAAQQVLARAQGDAAAFDKVYEQYRLAPEVTRRRMYYETMENVLRQTDKTIVESPGVQTYLPLPEVKKRQKAQPEGGE